MADQPQAAPEVELKHYYSIEELLFLEGEDLEALWDRVPPERQVFYEEAYENALSSLGFGEVSDDQFIQLTEQILEYYNAGQVPIRTGKRWVQVPGWIREMVEKGELYDKAAAATIAAAKAKPGAAAKGKPGAPGAGGIEIGGRKVEPQIIAMAAGGAFLLILFAVVFIRRAGRDEGVSEELIAQATAGEVTLSPEEVAALQTQQAEAQAETDSGDGGGGFPFFGGGGNNADEDEPTEEPVEAEAEATEEGPTPTPLPLEQADRIIQDGQFDIDEYFPVLLEVESNAQNQSRIFVVQQRTIEIADWEYDLDNPDVISWVTGLVVRPVMGIPISDENQALVNSLQPGDRLLMRMSTGTVLEFDVERVERVSRQDGSIFRQIQPGIALVLLGDTQTNDRIVVFGNYEAEQEISASQLAETTSGVLARANQPIVHGDTVVTVTVLDSYASAGSGASALPAGLTYLLVDLQIETGRNPASFSEFQLEILDDAGKRYTPYNIGAGLANYVPLTTQRFDPNTTTQGTVAFLVPEQFAAQPTLRLRVTPTNPFATYLLEYEVGEQVAPTVLEVLAVGADPYSEEGVVTVQMRVFNPSDSEAVLNPSDIYATFSPQQPESGTMPTGPQTFPQGYGENDAGDTIQLPLRLEPGQAANLQVSFAWDGSPYMGIYALGYQFVSELPQTTE